MFFHEDQSGSMAISDLRSVNPSRQSYVESARLSTKQPYSHETSLSGSSAASVQQAARESFATAASGFTGYRKNLPNFDSDLEEGAPSQLDTMSFYNHAIFGVPDNTLPSSMNANFPPTVSQATHCLTNCNGNYVDPSSQNILLSAATSYYQSADYPYLTDLSMNGFNCSTDYSHNVLDLPLRTLPGVHSSNMLKCDEPPIAYVYSTGLDSTQVGASSIASEQRDRYPNLLGRSARQQKSIYHPVGSLDEKTSNVLTTSGNNGVDLLVSNLDYNIGPKEWRKILFTQLQSTLKSVQSIVLQTQADGNNCAIIRVGSIEDARLAISHFHRRKIGYKRIQMNIIGPCGAYGTKGLKVEVISLLRSVSGNALPVCKFLDLFERRFHRNISISDLYKMRDVIEIKDQPGCQGGRLVTLNIRAMRLNKMEVAPLAEPVVCPRHCSESSCVYAQATDCSVLLYVRIPLGLFRQQVLKILQDHGGSLPLLSFPTCYKAEFGELPTVSSQSSDNAAEMFSRTSCHSGLKDNLSSDLLRKPGSPIDAHSNSEVPNTNSATEREDSNNFMGTIKTSAECSAGAPLEHLLTCVPSVRILTEANGVRRIVYEPDQLADTSITAGFIGQAQNVSGLEPLYDKRQSTDLLPPIVSTACPSTSAAPTLGGTSTPAGVFQDQLHQFSREVVDLLKHQPGCQILLSKFIPSYHHHFGKQCRVADYGYSKLHELFEALPNVVHVMGSGHTRLLILSHRVQVRRFTNELVKVLKSQSTKSCRLADYPTLHRRIFRKARELALHLLRDCTLSRKLPRPRLIIYVMLQNTHEACYASKTFFKKRGYMVDTSGITYWCVFITVSAITEFRITDYNVCFLTDMLMDVADSAVEISFVGSDYMISLPKRVQTMEERERTELFSIEIGELLGQLPRCRLPFNKFIPSYHHYFRRQCRVADYGFTKLVDLLEAVPNVVKIIEERGEKYVTLVKQRHLRIVAEHLLSMLEAAPGKRILVSELLNMYMKHHGYALCLEDFQFSSIKGLLSKLPRLVRIESTVNEDKTAFRQGNADEPTSDVECSDKLPENDLDMSNYIDRNYTRTDQPTSDAKKEVTSHATSRDEEYVCLADRTPIRHLAHKVLLVLLDVPTGVLPISMFTERFRCTFRDEPDVHLIYEELGDIVEFQDTSPQISNEDASSPRPNTDTASRIINPVTSTEQMNTHLDPCSSTKDYSIQPVDIVTDTMSTNVKYSSLNAVSEYIALKPLIIFARELRELLKQNQGKLLLIQLCTAYQRRFGVPLRPQRYNYPSLVTLLQAVDFVALMRGRGVRCTLVLCQDFLGKLSYRVAYNTKPTLESDKNGQLDPKTNSYVSVAQVDETTRSKVTSVFSGVNQPCACVSASTSTADRTIQACVLQANPSRHSQPTESFNGAAFHAVQSNNGIPVGPVRPYTNPYVPTSNNGCGQLGSYVNPTQFVSAAFGYYQIPPLQSTSYTHMPSGTRPTHTTSLILTAQSNLNYLPPNPEYNALATHPLVDCQSVNPAACTSMFYPSQTPQYGSPSMLINTGAAHSGTCFVAPNVETADISYPSSVYPSASMYPFPININYPSSMHPLPQQVHCAPPQQPTMWTTRPDARSQTIGTNSLPLKASSICAGGSNYYSPPKQTQLISLSNSIGMNLDQRGLSPRGQQQLDELVERLTYDNANPCSNNLLDLHSQSDGITTNQPVVPFPSTNETMGSSAVTPVSYRSLSTHSGLQFSCFGNMAMHTDCAQCPDSMLSTYSASPNAQMPFFAGSTFANVSTPRLAERGQYLSRGHTTEHVNSTHDPSESIPVSKQSVVVVSDRNTAGTLESGATSSGASSQGDIQVEQSMRPLESCNTVNQIMPSIVNCGPSGVIVNSPLEQSKSASEQRETIPRYTILHPCTNFFSTERPSEKIFSILNTGVCTTLCDPVIPVASLHSDELSSVSLVSSNKREAVRGLNLSHAGSHLNSLLSDKASINKQSSHSSVPYATLPLSQEEATRNFSLGGLLAQLRLEEKQQQRLQRSACGNPKSDLKENTHMLLDSFSYL
ncbi:meiosis arrest female protein 1 [Paragonimus westermani]|uniref:Meiosis arrest female protein 1 n=1 Tax=Paragonimus westermani TaxID=34504 RepID=A0A5J4NM73_9TREM|nr:meiosis arrest female protein 1 [Paragonimus westermani]